MILKGVTSGLPAATLRCLRLGVVLATHSYFLVQPCKLPSVMYGPRIVSLKRKGAASKAG